MTPDFIGNDDDYDKAKDDFIESINPNIYDMIC
jgi:hypothetical protein